MTESRERAVAFVVARLSSSRLPAKQLRHIGPKSILDWIMDALADCEQLDEIVLTTVAEDENRPLRDLAEARGWPCFWYEGEVDDVVGRLTAAARHHDAEICLLISADCPLIDSGAVDALVRGLRSALESDLAIPQGGSNGESCLLEGVHVARRRAWDVADAMSHRPELREHQFPVIYANPERFPRLDVPLDASLYGPRHRMSVDTWADLEFMQSLHDALQRDGLPFTLPPAVSRLLVDPSLRAINSHVHQRRLEEIPVRAVFAIDAGGEFGHGHYSRSREIATQLVERLGWSVRFVIDDAVIAERLTDAGFRVAWGAYGREVCNPSPDGVPDWQPGNYCADLLVVDVSARRPLTGIGPEYRPRARRIALIGRDDGPAADADLVVFPGATGRENLADVDGQSILSGMQYVVLRRDVVRQQAAHVQKDIDVFVYLYDEDQRQQLREHAARHGWRLVEADGFDDFLPNLARSRVFVSGFGQSFYEAVALGTRPVAWPLSNLHAMDAAAFFAAVGLKPLFVGSGADASRVLGEALYEQPVRCRVFTDGTPRIVTALGHLVNSGDVRVSGEWLGKPAKGPVS
jgi:spore coat polysaccharide biosynthesis protein SpsF